MSKKVVNCHLTEELAISLGVLDDIFEDLEVGARVKFEVFNVNYVGVRKEDEDSLMNRIQEDMVTMIQNKELVYVNDIEIFATVEEKTDNK